ncbi:TorF family putative porin [uncultured Brevundimonas sp.]|uniref:TorF family putative porin n=1 Tax=uncultured Brevundimonas sp. TaxID=213418 RepID=UPI00260E246B|nr:TorF family putative porin [uncultured Brevundimonas sp.]
MRLFSACAAAVALLASAGTASAQDADVSANVVVTSDYVFRGFSQTDEEPALQGSVDVAIGGFYAGAWASNVDFGDETDAEIDLYGGVRGEASGFAYDVGLVAYLYVGDSGADYDYVEVKAAVSRAVGPVTAGVAVYFSPDFFGIDEEATYVELNGAFVPADKWTVSGAVGEQFLNLTDDYTTWNLGAAYAFTDNLAVDVRYHGTDVESPISDDRVVGTVKVLF